MTTQTDTPLTIQEYATCHGISERTVRRRIKAGVLSARMEHGRYLVYGQNGVQPEGEAARQNGKESTQIGNPDVQSNGHENHAAAPERDAQQALIDQLTTENEFLREQLRAQTNTTNILAASTVQNREMAKQPKALPRPSIIDKARGKTRGLFNRLRKNTPESQTESDAS